MAKKKQNTVVNNIDSVNVEIDYKKLAKEIVAAQEEAEMQKKHHTRFRAGLMAVANAMIPIMIAIFALFACIGAWTELATAPKHSLISYILYTMMFTAIVVISVCCSVEAWKDDDENAMQHFNSNIGLVALVIAFIALMRDVG